MDTASQRLDSWKAIAEYLGRDRTTVMRWERTAALPSHGVVHSGPKEWPTAVVRQVIDSDYRVIQGLNCSSFSRRPAIDSAWRRSGYLPTRTRNIRTAPVDIVMNVG